MKRRIKVLDRTIACTDEGAGEPIIFLHGNPTSSYLWRNVLPHLLPYGRCVAPDLVGMGESDKLPDSGPGTYRFADHYRYLSALLAQLGLGANVTLVLHDWGSALGFHWARENAERIAGIAYMEALVRPVTWAEWPAPSRGIFQGMRSEKGEELVLRKNVFIERILPGSVMRRLSDGEMDAYRKPFTTPGEDRRPMLTWPRELPIEGEPADVVAVVQQYADWMSSNRIPKLFINAEPGAILVGAPREFCRSWPNQTEVTVQGIHFIQEDSPHEIGAALAAWIGGLR
ncbi:MAG: haloalkane dehalogenase [Gammaproteobacteria bacterium]|nr:haloalkane dehalogenase [Gammaproteobacteria bacterium]MDH5275097.1 haloalkane dehalogenase [Gammaproteobacteria bacterium]